MMAAGSKKFARVRFLEGEKLGKCEIVCTSRFKKRYTFDDCQFRSDMRYSLQNEENEQYTKVQILFVSNTRQEMDNKIDTCRAAKTPSRLLMSEESDMDDSAAKIKPSTSSKGSTSSTRTTKNFKPKTESGLADVLTERRKEKLQNQVLDKKRSGDSFDREVDERRSKKRRIDSDEEDSMNNSEFAENQTVEKNKSLLDTTNGKQVGSQVKPIGEIQNENETNAMESKKKDVRKLPDTALIKETKVIMPDAVLKLKDRQIADLSKKNKSLEKQCKNLKVENEKLNTECVELKDRNIILQDQVYQDIKEIKVLIDQRNQIENAVDKSMPPKLNNLPIGFHHFEKGIHLGQGIYMDETTHANLLSVSNSPSSFVGNILLAVYKIEVLLVSTITGRSSNRTKGELAKLKKLESDNEDDTSKKQKKSKQTKLADQNSSNEDDNLKESQSKAEKKKEKKQSKKKKRKSKHGDTDHDCTKGKKQKRESEDDTNSDSTESEGDSDDEIDETKNKENCPKRLDPKLLNACKDYYEYWLEHFYEKELTKKQAEKYKRSQELANFKDYATKKISGLKAPKAKKKESELKDPLALSCSDLIHAQESYSVLPINTVILESKDPVSHHVNEPFYDDSLFVDSSDEEVKSP